jgi:hypothetical protein
MSQRAAPRTFRADIPDELVLEFFNLVGVKSLSDIHWFPKSVLIPSVCATFDDLLVKLEPYYYPHKQFIVTRKMNQNRYIQILRQLAKAKGLTLESKEYKCSEGLLRKKMLMYRLKNNNIVFTSSEPIFTVTFE